MPDLGPNQRYTRTRPVMVVTRGYDPTQPNKTSFLAPPKTYTSITPAGAVDTDFIYSGMLVKRDTNGLMVPCVIGDFTGTFTSSQVGWAFQDSNRFDIVKAKMANAFSARSDGEIRTAWFDRSLVYKLDDALYADTVAGQITKTVTGTGIVGRVSALPKFEGGNPKIGNVNYSWVATLPTSPAATNGTTLTGYPALSAFATVTGTQLKAITDYNTLINAWVFANLTTDGSTWPTAINGGTKFTDATATGLTYTTGTSAGGFALTLAIYTAAVAGVIYGNTQPALRKAASDISSLQAYDNSMLTFVTARL